MVSRESRAWVWVVAAASLWAGCSGGEEAAAPPQEPDAAVADASDTSDTTDAAPEAVCTEAGGGELYARRIAPLLDESRPSSCNGCHLQGTELGAFVRGTPCEAMSCLIEGGLVELDAPEDSLILTWIERGLSSNSALPPEVASEELEAFRSWVAWGASCYADACPVEEQACPTVGPDWSLAHGQTPGGLRCSADDSRPECRMLEQRCSAGDRRVGCPDGPAPMAQPQPERCDPFDPACDPCAPEQVEFAFLDTVLRWRGRCEHCHAVGSPINVGSPPKWMAVGETRAAARASITNLEGLGALDAASPLESLMLLKPLGEELGGVPHLGGNKILSLEEPTYLDFTTWLHRYGRCHSDAAGEEEGE